MKIINIKIIITVIFDTKNIKMACANSKVFFSLGGDDNYDNYASESAYYKTLIDTSMYDTIPIKKTVNDDILILPIKQTIIVDISLENLHQKNMTLFDKFLNLFEYLTYV